MKISDIKIEGYERVAHAVDEASGLNAIIAIHDTTLGPALGGMRMQPYPFESEAIADATRLAQAMTYKAAVANTGQGGGKALPQAVSGVLFSSYTNRSKTKKRCTKTIVVENGG